MSKMNEISALMRELEQELGRCTKCGMCQSVCPLFEQTRVETDVARGKLTLMEGLLNGMFDDPVGTKQRLDKCLLCGSCAAHCPRDIHVPELVIKARAIMAGYVKLPLVKKIIFRRMLARPDVFDKWSQRASKLQDFFLTDRDDATQTASLKLVSPLITDRRIPAMPPLPFRESHSDLTAGLKNTGPAVAFFTGCLIDKIYPNVGRASIKALRRHNAQIVIPKNQGCCGIPALAAGETQVVSGLIERHVDLFTKQPFDYLVTSCATCASTIKKLWPAIYSGPRRDTGMLLAEFSEKTMDITEFLTGVMGAGPSNDHEKNAGAPHTDAPDQTKKTVAYHDPCHLAKSLGIRKEPRDLIAACPGYELKEMAHSDTCCGMGGSFNLSHYELSSRIGKLKQEAIEATNCHTVATSCPACMIQISDMLSKKSTGIYVKHPVELYAEGIDP